MLKTLKNNERAILLEDVKTLNGLLIKKGTKIIVNNILNVTAILETFRKVNKHLEFRTYKRFIIKSEAMFTKIRKI